MKIKTISVIGIVVCGLCFVFGCGGKSSSADSTNASSSPTPSSSPGSMASTGPIDGTWKLTGITCNGVAANSTVAAGYTSPNSQVGTFSGSKETLVVSDGTCTVTYSETVSYPTSNSVSVSGTGTVGCSPSGCANFDGITECGVSEPANTTVSTYSISGNTLTVTLPTTTTTDTCTSGGQSNPMVATYTKQ